MLQQNFPKYSSHTAFSYVSFPYNSFVQGFATMHLYVPFPYISYSCAHNFSVRASTEILYIVQSPLQVSMTPPTSMQTSQFLHSPFVSQCLPFLQILFSKLQQLSVAIKDCLCFSKLADGRFLVNISLVISAPDCHLTWTIPASFSSLKKYCFTSMCLVLPPTVQLLHKSFAPLLST